MDRAKLASASLAKLNWRRDWELLARCADILWASVGCHVDVVAAREQFANLIGCEMAPCSDIELQRFSPKIDPITSVVAREWVRVFSDWFGQRRKYVFSDVFCAVFFVRLLWANDVVLYRGHYHSRWQLSSTWRRLSQIDPNQLAHDRERGRAFMERVEQLPSVKGGYVSGIPESHREAILQHYGFPTRLIDMTYSSDVAIYFAEGGASFDTNRTDQPDCGAIYVVPTWALPASTRLVTLPPAVMRPTLQRGVFISDISDTDLQKIESLRFVFQHHGMPLWNGLTDIRFGSPVDLTRYLFPPSDEIASLLVSV